MAIITPTGTPETLTGKIGGDVLFLWKGKLCRKKGTPARKIQTHQRAWGKHLTNYLDNQWTQLSSVEQSCWDAYGTCAEINLPGVNSFFQQNYRLLFPQNPNLSQVDNPFHEPQVLATPTNVSLSYVGASTAWKFQWTMPAMSTLFIQTWGWKRATFQDSKGAFFTHQATVCSICGELIISAEGYQTGTILEGHIRAINLYGEVSGWTTVIKKEKE